MTERTARFDADARRPARRLVVIGGSAGSIEALRQVLYGLPADFSAAVCVVIHIPATRHSDLPALFKEKSALSVATADDGMAIQPGHVYVAPPDRHLVVEGDLLCVVRGPKENGFRPAVDVLFRSAAASYAEGVVGVILSGSLADGVRGAREIKAAGGRIIVQDPAEAMYPEMPRRARKVADFVEAPAAIPALLVRLMTEHRRDSDDRPRGARRPEGHDPDQGPRRTEFTCPECGGVLTELADRLTYRCHVGHAFSQDSLVAHGHETVEAALWRAIRVLNEQAKILRMLGRRMERTGSTNSAERFESRAAEAEQSVVTLKNLLLGSGLLDISEDELAPP
jgi:two-component system chemotaxis response regulator CheB